MCGEVQTGRTGRTVAGLAGDAFCLCDKSFDGVWWRCVALFRDRVVEGRTNELSSIPVTDSVLVVCDRTAKLLPHSSFFLRPRVKLGGGGASSAA